MILSDAPEKRTTVLFACPDSPDDSLPALQGVAESVLVARDTQAVHGLLESCAARAVFLDTALPGSHWQDLTLRLKRLDPDLPVILTAREPRKRDLVAGLRSGADLFLQRPLDAESLLGEALPLMARAEETRFHRQRQTTAAAILDAAPAPMVITDGQRLDYLNPPMLRMADGGRGARPRTCEEMERLMPLTRIHAVDEHSEFPCWIRAALENPGQEHLVRQGNGSGRTFLMRTAPVEGFAGRYNISFTDVTSIENERRLFHRLANTDPLTGVFNRRKFLEELEAEIRRARRYGCDLSMIMIDIDDFKAVNDSLGHQAGDIALSELAALLGAHIRSMDVLARYGGEEFALVIPETGLDGALYMAEKLRARVEENAFSVAPGMTCSMGVAGFHEEDSAASLLKRADQGLYRAKAEGKNRVGACLCVVPRRNSQLA
ncbi:sensor domain-containing diguanylate cyclase [Desulfocurvus sp. DL9XJH121]